MVIMEQTAKRPVIASTAVNHVIGKLENVTVNQDIVDFDVIEVLLFRVSILFVGQVNKHRIPSSSQRAFAELSWLAGSCVISIIACQSEILSF
jgi:hypothetical protein